MKLEKKNKYERNWPENNSSDKLEEEKRERLKKSET